MLTAFQSQECKKLLEKMNNSDLMALCDTVTNKQIAPETSDEAIDAIIRYSSSAEELLNRRKLKHEILFQYLYSASEMYDVSPKASKGEFVAKILKLWSEEKTQEIESQPNIQPGPNITINHIHNEVRNYTTVVTSPQTNIGEQLAKEFIGWFFTLLNTSSDPTRSDWGAKHFWPDVSLSLDIINETNEAIHERLEGADVVQERLSSIVQKESVVFNPNSTPEGCRGAISRHGLGKVAVCGTLHKTVSSEASHLIGVFEQSFGLMRDLNDENRWKIKVSELKIKLSAIFGHNPQITLSQETLKAISS